MIERVLKAFWHKGRRTTVAWTSLELERRTGLDWDDLQGQLQALAQKGWARGFKPSNRADRSTWELTPAGKAQAEQIIRAEALARSV